jgi:hypothetical protein
MTTRARSRTIDFPPQAEACAPRRRQDRLNSPSTRHVLALFDHFDEYKFDARDATEGARRWRKSSISFIAIRAVRLIGRTGTVLCD